MKDLPSLYHGIVHRSVLKRIQESQGKIVLGPSPDMSLAISIAIEEEEHYYTNFPITFFGAVGGSANSMGTKGEHVAKVYDVPWLSTEDTSKWSSSIPDIWTAETVTSQSVFNVLEKANNLEQLNFVELYKILCINHSNKFIIEDFDIFENIHLIDRLRLKLLIGLKKARGVLPGIFLSLYSILRGDLLRNQLVTGLNGYSNAVSCMNKYYSDVNFNFDESGK